MSERKWTQPQQNAISAQGGSILVSAAAGSGKTAVLVERAIRLICDEKNPIPADRLLVVTFSNAAAAEMKQRMNARLSAMIAQQPENIHLQQQQALLQGAQISTIHSFCLELIRQNFQYLDISPDFVLADEQEVALMERECVQDVIEEFYQDNSTEDFLGLVELLTNGRDDRSLIETILRIYTFSRSHPFYESWLDQKMDMYNPDIPVEKTVWGHTVLGYVKDSLHYCKRLLEEAVSDMAGDAALEKAYLPAVESDLAQVTACLSAIEAEGWDGGVRCLSQLAFARLGAVRGADESKERIKAARERSKKILSEIAEKYMNATAQEFSEDISFLRPKIDVLFQLVKAFAWRLWEVKGAKKRLDFSDLEHLALGLLVEKKGTTYQRTEKAVEIAERFSIVMVDEYQDTNEVQDLIFTSVSDMQNNLFMVGDVKQSIYSFRQAMPEIFMQKKQVFSPYEQSGQFPAKIILDTNFRSRNTVTEGINYLFEMLMSEEIGEMVYGEEERLKCGAVYPKHSDAQPEVLVLDGAQEAREALDAEAQEVAEKIRQMLQNGYQVSEGERLRPAQPKDFCILLRSPRKRAETYVNALMEKGVPAWTETSGGYLQAREVATIISLLKAIDNPLLDIELVAALLSPFFLFTDDDIARIRLEKRDVPFYQALELAAERGDKKSEAFLGLFHHLRRQAALLPADQLLLELYDKTNAIALVRAMRLGEARAANLRLLAEYAASYHRLGYKRLGGFVSFLNRLEERGGDLAPAGSTSGEDAANAVRVLSIHKSKGLEYPVVFLCDSFRQFNKVDLRASTLLHSKYGFACVRRDHISGHQFATVPMQAIRLESERSLLSEELRILYVALTRAKEKLIITGFCKNKLQKRLAGLYSTLQGGKLAAYNVRSANCYADWILMALMHHTNGDVLREAANLSEGTVVGDENRWHIAIQTPQKEDLEAKEALFTEQAQPDKALLSFLREAGAFTYPYRAQTTIPTKLAVSAVAKEDTIISHRFSARPRFMEFTGLTGAQRGNALHKFMQFADYYNARGDLEAEIKAMERKGFLSPIEAQSLSRRRLQSFFKSKLAERIFSSPKVLRELKFMAECGLDVLGEHLEGMDETSKVVLQGVADCVFYEIGGAVIVDYKTDVVKDAQELRTRYQKQVMLYKHMLQSSLDAPITQCLLYSFHLNQEILIL